MPTYGPFALPYPNGSDVPDVPGAFLTLDQRLTTILGPVASKAARDALWPTPSLGDKVFRTDKGREETYFDNSAGGKTTAGWYQTGGNPLTFTPTLLAGWVDAAITAYGPPNVNVSGGVGVLHLIIKSGTAAVNTSFMTLPSGCQPAHTELLFGVGSTGQTITLQLVQGGNCIAVTAMDATYTFVSFVYDVAEVPVAD